MVLSKIASTTDACRNIVPMLSDLNQKSAFKKGLVLVPDLNALHDKRINPSMVRKWIDFFKKDPERFSELRKKILDSVRSSLQVQERKNCPVDGALAQDSCKKLITVNFGNYNNVSNSESTAFGFIALGDPFLAGLALSDGVSIEGTMAELDVTVTPSIPKKFR